MNRRFEVAFADKTKGSDSVGDNVDGDNGPFPIAGSGHCVDSVDNNSLLSSGRQDKAEMKSRSSERGH